MAEKNMKHCRQDVVYAVDLSKRRHEAGLTQEGLGELLGVGRLQVYRYENGHHSIPFERALRCAKEFGGLRVSFGDGEFLLRPEAHSASDGAECEVEEASGNWTSNAVNSAQQARELMEWAEKLGQHLHAIDSGEGADAYLIRGYKEAREAELAIRDLLNEGDRRHPHLVQHGIEMARRVAAARRSGECQFEVMEGYIASLGTKQPA